MNRSWLAPLTPLYAAGLALRNRRIESGSEPVRRLRWPVVSIGNLSTGGSGKTPLTITLAQALTARGLRVDVLSRGYGRQSKLPAQVDPDGAAQEFGDEPLLIARETGLPVYVAPQRYDAGLLAEADELKGADFSPYKIQPESARAFASEVSRPGVHLLDDGFQHRQLHRDIDILLLNRDDLADRLLPAGNLREPLNAFQRATVLAVPADEPEVEQCLREIIQIDQNSEISRWIGPVWRLHRKMQVPAVAAPVAAFCGIARPEQFFQGLASAGLRLAVQTAFPDHHAYTAAGLERLAAAARASGATALITTEKDRARLGQLSAGLPLLTAGLRIEIEDESAAVDWLITRLASAPPHPPL
jgi:tetraacyldisaccharide 4'-kinase